MSQTTGAQYSAPSATFNEDLFHAGALEIQQNFAILGLLSGLYGILTVLSILSIWALTRRKGTRRQPNALPLCLTILALFISTTAYMVTCMLSCQNIFLKAFISSGYALWSYSIDLKFPDAPSQLVKGYDYTRLHSCASTAAITINITLGDAIVCWRACVVWYHHRAVRAVLSAFLLATFVLGVADTAWGCRAPYHVIPLTLYSFVPLGTSFEGLPLGLAACVLSLATNLLATLLVGHKAWCAHTSPKSARSLTRVPLAMAPSAGSAGNACGATSSPARGALRCRSSSRSSSSPARSTAPSGASSWRSRAGRTARASRGAVPVANGFLNVFNVLVSGALVPLIAIYPAAIIVLVALDRSHIERGLTQHAEAMNIAVPTLHISNMVDTAQNGVHDESIGLRWKPREGATFNERGVFGPKDGGSEDVSVRTGDSDELERKVEEFV